MIHVNSDVAFTLLGVIVIWGYSRWLVATEHRKYRRARLWIDRDRQSDGMQRNGR